MNFVSLLSSISFSFVAISLFVAMLLATIMFLTLNKKAQSPLLVKKDEESRIKSRRKVLYIIIPLLSLSLLFGVGMMSNVETQSKTSRNVYIQTQTKNSTTATKKGLSVSSIKTKEGKKLSIQNATITSVDFVFTSDMKNTNQQYGVIIISYKTNNSTTAIEDSTESSGSSLKRDVQRHEAEDNDNFIYYYITLENSSEKYIIEEYSISWTEGEWYEVFKQFLDDNLTPIIITLLVAGAFLAIILGINLAKAEDSGSAAKLKTRMWQLFFGIFILIALIFFLYWLLGNISGIMNSESIKSLEDTFSSSDCIKKL